MSQDRILRREGVQIPYTVVRSDRRTMSVSVSPQGVVSVRAPRWLPERKIKHFLAERSAWIANKHAEAVERAARSLGAVTDSEMALARTVFPERYAACWAVFARPGEAMPELRVRAMRTRWGSLTASGRITLNAVLVRASAECLDYVIFHELCHIRVRGHGPAFYAELARYVPEWRARKRILREVVL